MENTINGTLNLDTEAKRTRINEGYNDTMNKLMPIVEMVKFIKEKEEEKRKDGRVILHERQRRYE